MDLPTIDLDVGPSWSFGSCATNLTVTTQADVANINVTDTCLSTITVTNAQGSLSFDNLRSINGIYVRDSPSLETLSFPDLDMIAALGIYDATALTNISLPQVDSYGVMPFGDGGWAYIPPRNKSYLNLTVHNSPSLQTINFASLTGFFGLDLVGADNLKYAVLEDPGLDQTSQGFLQGGGITNQVNSSHRLYLDGCFDLVALDFAQNVHITGRQDCGYGLFNLHSATNLTLTNTATSTLDIDSPFVVNASFTADQLYVPADNTSAFPEPPIGWVGSIGYHATLTSSSNVDLSLDKIESRG
ncbi:hypothetical protein F4777DRAFT_92026 [Nemania sp. FL0916]|nr:hypothetical protein F4777DRAFT_92026 [Nemania sp. FL0916]